MIKKNGILPGVLAREKNSVRKPCLFFGIFSYIIIGRNS